MQKPKVIVILGQTATGKSDLAVRVAKKFNGEIISADSRQVYKGLDIGTGKITKQEMQGVRHHLLDVVSPKKKFSVVEYKKLAEEKIEEIISRKKIPIICGGTGFYIDATTKGIVFPEVPPNYKLRKILEKKSEIQLFQILKKLDKIRIKSVDVKNKVRLIRAIEIAKALGKVPKITQATPVYKFIKIGLYLPADKLKEKVKKRVRGMFKSGLLKEITRLKKLKISKRRLREFGFEYNDPTEEKVVKETLKYAKRQMTWFKRPARPPKSGAGGDKEIKWLDASSTSLFHLVYKHLKQYWN